MQQATSTAALLKCILPIPESDAISDLARSFVQHEAALTKAEETLEEDSVAFDKFLKESDEKVQQAMSKADAEMKAKQEKVRAHYPPMSVSIHVSSISELCHLSSKLLVMHSCLAWHHLVEYT